MDSRCLPDTDTSRSINGGGGMGIPAVIGILLAVLVIYAVEVARHYIDRGRTRPEESNRIPPYLVASLPEREHVTPLMRELFDVYEDMDVRVTTLILPAAEWPRIRLEFNATSSHESPDAVGTLWGAEVFLHRSGALVALILPNEHDLDRFHQ